MARITLNHVITIIQLVSGVLSTCDDPFARITTSPSGVSGIIFFRIIGICSITLLGRGRGYRKAMLPLIMDKRRL